MANINNCLSSLVANQRVPKYWHQFRVTMTKYKFSDKSQGQQAWGEIGTFSYAGDSANIYYSHFGEQSSNIQ